MTDTKPEKLGSEERADRISAVCPYPSSLDRQEVWRLAFKHIREAEAAAWQEVLGEVVQIVETNLPASISLLHKRNLIAEIRRLIKCQNQ